MPDPAAQVKINALLMQREAAFIRIWEIEQRLPQILGQPFPLTIPVDLPSRRPPRKAGAKPRPADARPRIRSQLREGETAWLITYRHRGEVHQRLETSPDTIRDLAGIDTPFLQILRIDTVCVNATGYDVVETLFER